MYLVFRVSFSALQLYLSVCCWGRRLDPDATRALQVELVHVAGVLLVELSNQQNTYVVDFKNVTNHLLKMKATSHEVTHTHSNTSHDLTNQTWDAWATWDTWPLEALENVENWEPENLDKNHQQSHKLTSLPYLGDMERISWWRIPR